MYFLYPESFCFGFNDDNYNWYVNCDQLSSDFVRLVTALGITATLHKWISKQANDGDMYKQRTKSFDPVGTSHDQKVYEWVYHQWAEAASNQWDPSAIASKNGNPSPEEGRSPSSGEEKMYILIC